MCKEDGSNKRKDPKSLAVIELYWDANYNPLCTSEYTSTRRRLLTISLWCNNSMLRNTYTNLNIFIEY